LCVLEIEVNGIVKELLLSCFHSQQRSPTWFCPLTLQEV